MKGFKICGNKIIIRESIKGGGIKRLIIGKINNVF